MVPQDKVIDLLAAGISQAAIAQACSCDASYISQLAADPQIAAAVSQKRIDRATKEVTSDNKVQDIRGVLINRLHELASMITKPMEVLAALKTVDEIARKSAIFDRPQQSAGGARVVQLVLPQNSQVNFTLSPQREVIEVDGRALQTMPAGRIFETLASKTIEAEAESISASPAKFAARPNEPIRIEDF